MAIKPLSRKNNIVVQQIEDETLVYDLITNKAFCLNKTAAEIWQLCNGLNSVSEMTDKLRKRLKTLASEEMVRIALDLLRKDDLLEDEDKEKLKRQT